MSQYSDSNYSWLTSNQASAFARLGNVVDPATYSSFTNLSGRRVLCRMADRENTYNDLTELANFDYEGAQHSRTLERAAENSLGRFGTRLLGTNMRQRAQSDSVFTPGDLSRLQQQGVQEKNFLSALGKGTFQAPAYTGNDRKASQDAARQFFSSGTSGLGIGETRFNPASLLSRTFDVPTIDPYARPKSTTIAGEREWDMM